LAPKFRTKNARVNVDEIDTLPLSANYALTRLTLFATGVGHCLFAKLDFEPDDFAFITNLPVTSIVVK